MTAQTIHPATTSRETSRETPPALPRRLAHPIAGAIHNLAHTILFARDLEGMRRFYSETMGFEVHRELGPTWIEYRVGGTVLALSGPQALTERSSELFDDPPPPPGALSVQLA